MNGETPDTGVRQHLRFLAGQLTHRGANTENERRAAEYIRKHFQENNPYVAVEEFNSIDSYQLLFASYFAEFFFVALLALWLPAVAFVYGMLVFVTYMAESTGYRIFSRFLPEYSSQNVVSHHLAENPRRHVVVMAHYDSPKDTALVQPDATRWLRPAAITMVVCMTTIVLSTLTQALGTFEDLTVRADLIACWGAVGILTTAAGWLGLSELSADYLPGANNNASGVASVMELNERLSNRPLEQCDVWIVATGSKEGWLNGARRFVAQHDFDLADTWFINVEQIGIGRLHCVTGEGVLHTFHADQELVELLSEAGGGLPQHVHRGAPTDALIPLARGYRCAGLMGAPDKIDEAPPDTLAHIDYDAVEGAVDVLETALRRLDDAFDEQSVA